MPSKDKPQRRPSGASPRSSGTGRKPGKRTDDGEEGPSQWGALARRGSRRLAEDVRDAGNKAPQQGPPAPREPQDRWVQDEVRSTATEAVGRAQQGTKTARPSPLGSQRRGSGPRRRPDERPRSRNDGGRATDSEASEAGRRPEPDLERAEVELAKAVGPQRADRSAQRLRDATRAFEREQYSESRRILRQLAKDAPGATAVRELLGLSYYRLGQWTQAVRELEAFRDMTGSSEQNPVLADCYRALKRWAAVEDLWNELREDSPSGDLVAEGRIVMAGALADQRKLSEAIRLLEQAPRRAKRPQVHHLRVAYALADLRERSGDVPGARELFEWVHHQEPDFADAHERARNLA